MLHLWSKLRSRTLAGGAALLVAATLAVAPAMASDPLTVRDPHRPHSADAAERWWASCTADLPRSADAAERAAADCW